MTSYPSLLKAASTPIENITLDGNQDLSLATIISASHQHTTVTLLPSDKVKQRTTSILENITLQIENGVPIYGVTSAYGAQAGTTYTTGEKSAKLENATALSNSIIHVDVSTGPLLPDEIVRAAMLIRLNMLLPGFSGVRPESLNLLASWINSGTLPLVGQYGTVGASGDLAQNGRVLSMLLHRPETKVKLKNGDITTADKAGEKLNLPPLKLEPKEGLALVNGDNFSTATAALITHDITYLTLLNLYVAAINIQALKGSIRNFHPLLSAVRPHPGQEYTANILRQLLTGSQLARNDLKQNLPREKGEIIQDPYSLRCLPQYYGPDWETISQAWETVVRNANSVSDNPLWTTPETVLPGEDPYQWVSGGNFLAMHMSDTLDKLRKIAIHIVKQNDRHLARLIHPQLNNGLPANLSDQSAISQCTFKGLQTQMGMYEVYATLLAQPVSTAFGTHEELNQDITSHAMTSGVLTFEVLEITKRAIATNLIAGCQAIDLHGGPHLLSPLTKPLYEWARNQVPYIKTEQPLGHYVEEISQNLLKPECINVVIDGLHD
jgi:phenylalanine ammonia-lyase